MERRGICSVSHKQLLAVAQDSQTFLPEPSREARNPKWPNGGAASEGAGGSLPSEVVDRLVIAHYSHHSVGGTRGSFASETALLSTISQRKEHNIIFYLVFWD